MFEIYYFTLFLSLDNITAGGSSDVMTALICAFGMIDRGKEHSYMYILI